MASNRPGTLPRLSRALLLAVVVCGAAVCQAKNNCAWINEATASGLLGGEAVGEFTEASLDRPAICTFTEKDAAATRTLRITVQVAADVGAGFRAAAQACGADATPIQAIGNQAVICAADDRKGALGERVVGRVRNQIFTITLGTSIKADLLLTREALKSRIYTAAEQVSGNLF
jgi:hypothetical protein